MNSIVPTQINEWESFVSAGIVLAQAQDRNRWALGDLAERCERKYGDGSLGKLAYAINVRTKTFYEYHRVYSFYGEYSTDVENLTWSHYREAMRLGDLQKALWALDKASERDWRVEKFSAVLSRYLGNGKPERTASGHKTDNAALILDAAPTTLQRVVKLHYSDTHEAVFNVSPDQAAFLKQLPYGARLAITIRLTE